MTHPMDGQDAYAPSSGTVIPQNWVMSIVVTWVYFCPIKTEAFPLKFPSQHLILFILDNKTIYLSALY